LPIAVVMYVKISLSDSKFVCLIQSACEVYIDVKAHSCIYRCFLSARFQHFKSVILCCWTKLSD